MDSKKILEDNLNSNKKFVEEITTRDGSMVKKENQNELKNLITKVDNRVKTKVNYFTK